MARGALPPADAAAGLLARADALRRRARPAPAGRPDRAPYERRAGHRELRALGRGRRPVGAAADPLLLGRALLPAVAAGPGGAGRDAHLPPGREALLGPDQACVAREAPPLRLAERGGGGDPGEPDARAGVEPPGCRAEALRARERGHHRGAARLHTHQRAVWTARRPD